MDAVDHRAKVPRIFWIKDLSSQVGSDTPPPHPPDHVPGARILYNIHHFRAPSARNRTRFVCYLLFLTTDLAIFQQQTRDTFSLIHGGFQRKHGSYKVHKVAWIETMYHDPRLE